MKCFVDSNVFISLIYDEFGKRFEFMSYRAEEFFNRVLSCFHTIILSEAVISEICRITFLAESDIISRLEEFRDKVSVIRVNKRDILESRKINAKYRTGSADALHFVIARESGCDCIVTWNKKDFVFPENELLIFDPGEL